MPKAHGLLLAIWAACGTLFATAHAAPTIKVLTTLDRFEPFEAHLFHAGHLWVGRSRQDLGAFYRLEVYGSDGAAQGAAELVHSLRYIYPYAADSVIIVGVGLDQMSHYTIARFDSGRLRLTEQRIPMTALADRFLGTVGHFVFSDPGGYDDPNHPTDPSTPLPTLFNVTRSGSTRFLAPRIASPRKGLTIGTALYLISTPSAFAGGRTLNKVDTAGETFTKLLENRAALTDMVVVSARNLLALSESDAGQIIFVDLKTDRLGETISTAAYGYPRALATMNNCLLVGTEDTKQILVYDLTAADHSKPISQWDLAAAGDTFYQLRDLAVDASNGHVFARSAYACNPADGGCGEHGRNSVIMIIPEDGDPAGTACATNSVHD